MMISKRLLTLISVLILLGLFPAISQAFTQATSPQPHTANTDVGGVTTYNIALSKQDKEELIKSLEHLSWNEVLYSALLGVLIGAVFMLLPMAYMKSDIREKISGTNDRITHTNDKLVNEFRNIEKIQLDTFDKHRSIEGAIKEIKDISNASKNEIQILGGLSAKLDPDLKKDIEKRTSKIIRKINKTNELSRHLVTDFASMQQELTKLDLAIKSVEHGAIKDTVELQSDLAKNIGDVAEEVTEIRRGLLTDISVHSKDINAIKNDINNKLDQLQRYIDGKISTLTPIDYNELDRRAEYIFDTKYNS